MVCERTSGIRLALLMGDTAVAGLTKVKGDKAKIAKNKRLKMSDFHHLFRLFFFLLSLAASFIGLWMWAVLFWTCFPCCNLRGAVLFAGSTSSGCCATTKTVPFTPTTSPSFPLLCEWSHAPLCELGHSWGNSSRQTSKVCGGVIQHW